MKRTDSFITQISQRLADYQPSLFGHRQPQAAVLVPLILDPEPSVLLTVRASHLNSHPGQVSFPGGMAEAGDQSLADTALRETFEEIALASDRIELLGKLSTALSKDGVAVHPFVGITEHCRDISGSPDEIAEVFTVPWSFFAEQAPELRPISRHGIEFQVPHFHYQGQHIWGLTAMIMLELVNLVEGTQWPVPDFSLAGEHRSKT